MRDSVLHDGESRDRHVPAMLVARMILVVPGGGLRKIAFCWAVDKVLDEQWGNRRMTIGKRKEVGEGQ